MSPCCATSRLRLGRLGVGLGMLVAQAAWAQSSNLFAGDDPIPALRPPRDVLTPSFWEQHAGLLVLILVLVAVAVTVLVWWLKRPRPQVLIPPDVIARQSLEKLRGRPEDVRLAGEVAHTLHRYVIAVLGWRPDELTTEELLAEAGRDPLVSPEIKAALAAVLRECDAKKFLPAPAPGEAGLVKRALEIVGNVEARRKPPAVPSPLPGATAAA